MEAAGHDLIAAVNLSPRNLHDAELPERVRALLDLLGAPASMLELEITESVIMSDPLRSLQVLTRLSKMGLRLAVDDFGTGYSSFSYLRKLPVHEIKIDKSFIDDMVEDGDEVIVQSTIELAHNLGLTCVAEGVQDQATLERLAKLGCDTAQGDFISPPLDGEGVVRMASSARARPGDTALILAILSGIFLALSFPRYGHPALGVDRAGATHRRALRTPRSDTLNGLRPRSSGACLPPGICGRPGIFRRDGLLDRRRCHSSLAGSVGLSASSSRRCSSPISSLFPALFALCLGWLGARCGRRAILLAPAIWVTTELGRTYFWSGFPWLLLGYSQTTVLSVAQLASVVGVFGMSALVAVVSAALAYFAIARSGESLLALDGDRRLASWRRRLGQSSA